MENDRTFAIVVGYHDCSYPPPLAYDAGLTNRFAVVLDTYRRDKGVMYFDFDLFIRILESICQAIPHDSTTIVMGTGQEFRSIHDLSMSHLGQTDDDREPPIRIHLLQVGRLAAYAEIEPWALVGGPAPYHDSYTLSFYTREARVEEFHGICESISNAEGARISGVHKDLSSKEPFTPLWKIPLTWLGAKAW